MLDIIKTDIEKALAIETNITDYEKMVSKYKNRSKETPINCIRSVTTN